ncbi:WXG100 family type VII secretion target [Bifidobacterium sp.]|jgi:WXG100 family type VII secretion target|uniref:WXG100 family type VII secretion target n=1 Tax=Bifidobacterium sp. TaxID=41200 RepID=UPI0025C1F541|nr:WXG100 family type VII secretion target [Bifidobacterium sp.]MCI1635556.1 WXG100 family type VII secretion target [Bifidobacterium sp.]
MTNFQVDSEQIRTSSAAVQHSIEAIRDSVHGMYGNLQGLEGIWTGSAATQFTQISQQWRNAQIQMEQSLEAIQRALTQASSLYEEAESQATMLFVN